MKNTKKTSGRTTTYPASTAGSTSPELSVGVVRPENIIVVDQEQGKIVMTRDGKTVDDFDPARLPAGGGYIVGDTNVLAVQNETSVSQYGWKDSDARRRFLALAHAQGYRVLSVSNKHANKAKRRYDPDGPKALELLTLHADVREKIARTGRYDSGRPVTGVDSAGVDSSHGERDKASLDFLRIQNGGKKYDCDFVRMAIAVAHSALDKYGKTLFGLQVRKPVSKSPNKIVAVAVAVLDSTGRPRTFNGRLFGIGFITRNVLGLNGTISGVKNGGSPMRAVLRVLGRRSKPGKIDKAERAAFDRYVKTLIHAFQATYPVLTAGSTSPALSAGA